MPILDCSAPQCTPTKKERQTCLLFVFKTFITSLHLKFMIQSIIHIFFFFCRMKTSFRSLTTARRGKIIKVKKEKTIIVEGFEGCLGQPAISFNLRLLLPAKRDHFLFFSDVTTHLCNRSFPSVRRSVLCYFPSTSIVVTEGQKSSNRITNNDMMSDDEEVVSHVPPRYLFFFFSTHQVARIECYLQMSTDANYQ